jgi:hypothetical protein
VWWLVVAVAILLRHPDVMRTAEYLRTLEYHKCVERMEEAMECAELLSQTDAAGVVHQPLACLLKTWQKGNCG